MNLKFTRKQCIVMKNQKVLIQIILLFTGKVQFELHSEALDDPGRRGRSSIMVNGVEYCPRKRGHNVVVLDEVGTVVSVQSFDTSDENGGIAFAKFLDEIPKEHVALIAVQDTTGMVNLCFLSYVAFAALLIFKVAEYKFV